MIRILAVSISAAALFAATLPANAQSRQGNDPQSQQGRSPSQPSVSPGQGQGPSSGQRNFRSFNPPAPGGQSGQVQPRAFNPPAPGNGTSQRSFGPQAPTGGQNFVGGPRGVPGSLPAPSLGQSTPTGAPAVSGPQQAAAPGQPTDAPQGDLQAPIPQTVTGQVEPTSAEQMPAEQMPVAEGDQPAPQTVVTQGGETPAVGETRRAVKVVPGHAVRKFIHAPEVVVYHQHRRVYAPVYVQRHHYVHVPQHHGFYGHRVHHGHRGHGHRHW
jgi:hypothetical protein